MKTLFLLLITFSACADPRIQYVASTPHPIITLDTLPSEGYLDSITKDKYIIQLFPMYESNLVGLDIYNDSLMTDRFKLLIWDSLAVIQTLIAININKDQQIDSLEGFKLKYIALIHYIKLAEEPANKPNHKDSLKRALENFEDLQKQYP